MGCTVSKSRVVVSSIREQQQSMTSIAPPATQSSASSVGLQDSQEAERVSSSTPKGDVADSLTIVHFNDVYEVQEREKEPVGGAARFKTAVDNVARKQNPLVVFSGDCLNPSACKYTKPQMMADYSFLTWLCLPLLSLSLSPSPPPSPPLSPSAVSVATEGKHMVPVLNSLGVHLATYGNHEFGESILLSQYNDAAVLRVCQHPLSILYCLALSQYFVNRCDSVCVCTLLHCSQHTQTAV